MCRIESTLQNKGIEFNSELSFWWAFYKLRHALWQDLPGRLGPHEDVSPTSRMGCTCEGRLTIGPGNALSTDLDGVRPGGSAMLPRI